MAYVREPIQSPLLARAMNARRRHIWGLAVQHGLFVLAPVLTLALVLVQASNQGALGVDFGPGAWLAGNRVLHGLTPWAASYPALLDHGWTFIYPAAAAVLTIPLSILPEAVAIGLVLVFSAAAVLATLRICGVRDWRVAGAVFLWPAVSAGLQTGNITLLLIGGLAATWRWRDRPWVAGILIALMISIKPFVWPVALWLVLTRRWAAVGWAIVCGVVVNVISWSIVGWDQISVLARLLHQNTQAMAHQGYSVMRLLGGNADPAALALALLAVAGLMAWATRLWRAGREDSAFSVCVIACLVASPLVWLHDLALLIVPLALTRPRLSVWWLLPIVLRFPVSDPETWQVVVALGVVSVVSLVAGFGSARECGPGATGGSTQRLAY